MDFIPPRPFGDDEEARGLQALWDRQWGSESIFIDTDGLYFDKQPDGRYVPRLKTAKSGTVAPPIMFPFKIYQIGGAIQIRSGIVGYRSKFFANATYSTYGNSEQQVNCQCTDSTWLVDDPPSINTGPAITLTNGTDSIIVDAGTNPSTPVYYGSINPAAGADENGEINMAFWLKIVDQSTGIGTFSQLYGRMWTRRAASATGRRTAMFPAPDKNIVPLGTIGIGANPFLEQIQWGNLCNRYPMFPTDDVGTVRFGENLISAGGSALNYRGDWDADNLNGQVFYPGDLVCDSTVYTKEIGITISGGSVPVLATVKQAYYIHRGFDGNPIGRPTGDPYGYWLLVSEIFGSA